MTGAEKHAAILRAVALEALADARAAYRKATAQPDEMHTRAAFRACVFAARALRRASEQYPDDEQEMLDRAALVDEMAVGLKRKLARLAA